jgi:hypothetical protein
VLGGGFGAGGLASGAGVGALDVERQSLFAAFGQLPAERRGPCRACLDDRAVKAASPTESGGDGCGENRGSCGGGRQRDAVGGLFQQAAPHQPVKLAQNVKVILQQMPGGSRGEHGGGVEGAPAGGIGASPIHIDGYGFNERLPPGGADSAEDIDEVTERQGGARLIRCSLIRSLVRVGEGVDPPGQFGIDRLIARKKVVVASGGCRQLAGLVGVEQNGRHMATVRTARAGAFAVDMKPTQCLDGDDLFERPAAVANGAGDNPAIGGNTGVGDFLAFHMAPAQSEGFFAQAVEQVVLVQTLHALLPPGGLQTRRAAGLGEFNTPFPGSRPGWRLSHGVQQPARSMRTLGASVKSPASKKARRIRAGCSVRQTGTGRRATQLLE